MAAQTLNQAIYQCGWRHLFSGKRQTQCINDWIEDQLGRSATSGGNAQVAKSMIAPPRPRYPQADSQGTERLMVQVAMLAALAVIGYFIYKS